jgi:proline dehydrogenase
LDLDAEETFQRLRRLAERSAAMGKHLFLDMESAPYVEPTIAIYHRLREELENTGVCIQAYLHRTPQDVADLLAAGGSLRLVKGAYREHADVAIHDHGRIRATFQKLALEFLRATGGGRLALGSHDLPLLTEIERRAAAAGFGRDAYEIQMLYGIRVADQKRLAAEGFRIRVLISYGSHWYPWFMRRLAEHPGRNLWLAIRNLFARR